MAAVLLAAKLHELRWGLVERASGLSWYFLEI